MAFPSSPVNGQTAVVNNITYVYNSSIQSWTRVQNAGGGQNPALYLGSKLTTNVATLVDTLPIAGNTYLRWTVTSIDNTNSNFAGTLFDSINDGTNVYYAQTGTLQSNPTALVATFTSNISSGNINLWAVGDSNNVTVSFKREVLGSSTSIGYLNAGPQGAQGIPGPAGTINNTSGTIQTTSTTPATSTTTGALLVGGGAGIGGSIYAGGTVYGQAINATNGIEFNNANISLSTTIPANTNAKSVGPLYQLPGVTITQAPGSRWLVL